VGLCDVRQSDVALSEGALKRLICPDTENRINLPDLLERAIVFLQRLSMASPPAQVRDILRSTLCFGTVQFYLSFRLSLQVQSTKYAPPRAHRASQTCQIVRLYPVST